MVEAKQYGERVNIVKYIRVEKKVAICCGR